MRRIPVLIWALLAGSIFLSALRFLAFRAEAVRVEDPRHLTVRFNGPIDTASVTPRDIHITPDFLVPQSLFHPNDSSITCTFSQPIEDGKHELVISAIRGSGGESPLLPLSIAFTVFAQPAPGDVLISEFLFDPPTGQPEFAELYNNSGKTLNLAGWQFGDATGPEPITRDTLELPAGQYLVLTSDASALQAAFGPLETYKMAGFPALNNSGDLLQLMLPDGRISDSLKYASSWGTTDTSLERRSMQVPAFYRENWAPSPVGATPGKSNAVERDTTAPRLDDFEVRSPRLILLTFDERLGAAPGNSAVVFTPSIAIADMGAGADTLWIRPAADLQNNLDYSLRLTGVQDLFGNKRTIEHAFSYFQVSEAGPGDVVINEFLAQPAAAGPGEFVEVLNTTERNFSVGGWRLGDARHSVELESPAPPSSHILKAHGYLVLTADRDLASSIDNALYISGFPALNNGEDKLHLHSAKGITLDSLSYGKQWPEARKGYSLERIDPIHPANDPTNWKPALPAYRQTAGVVNTRHKTDLAPPDMEMATTTPAGQIEIHFNEFVQLSAETSISLDSEPLEIASYDSTQAATWRLKAPSGIPTNGELMVEAKGLEDFNGNRAQHRQIPLARSPLREELVLNEIMYEPLQDARDGKPDQGEYLEYYNRSGHALSLEGLWIHDEPDENGRVSSLTPMALDHRWLPAGGYLLIYADTSSFFKTSRLGRAFGAKDSLHAFRIDQLSLGLSSDGETLMLADSLRRLIDSVRYQAAWHNPNLVDTRGLALERVNPEITSNNPPDWGTSSAPGGGTPGRVNSILQLPDKQETGSVLALTPNPFSPDGDGHDDRLLLQYYLNEPDYLLRVRIFDRFGHRVRTLADGAAAGTRGTLVWDGLSDDRRDNRIGIYIILFEAYDSAAGSRRQIKKTVVLAREM